MFLRMYFFLYVAKIAPESARELAHGAGRSLSASKGNTKKDYGGRIAGITVRRIRSGAEKGGNTAAHATFAGAAKGRKSVFPRA